MVHADFGTAIVTGGGSGRSQVKDGMEEGRGTKWHKAAQTPLGLRTEWEALVVSSRLK